jgi:hypothetical protein
VLISVLWILFMAHSATAGDVGVAAETTKARVAANTESAPPEFVTIVFPKASEPAPPARLNEGTKITIFSDGRWVCDWVIRHSSRHAKHSFTGDLSFQYTTSPHEVKELGQTQVITAEMSHSDKHPIRDFKRKETGTNEAYAKHFDMIVRGDTRPRLHLTVWRSGDSPPRPTTPAEADLDGEFQP